LPDAAPRLDPLQVEKLQKEQKGLENFLDFFPAGQKVYGLPAEAFKKPLLDWLHAFAEGRLAEYKYGNPISEKQLAALSPEARALWARESVTARHGGGVADTPALTALLPLLKGLAAVLPRVKLDLPGQAAVGFDEPSRARLAEARDRLVGELRAAPKGSPEHSRLKGEIGPIADRLAILELKLKLDEALARQASVTETLLEVRALFPGAARALRRFGGGGIAETIGELAAPAKQLKSDPRQGLYAVDEDHLDAWLNSFVHGCMNPIGANGFNKGCIAEKMSNGRYKMCRAYDGEEPIARSFLRLLDVRVGNYQGPALWLDEAQTMGIHVFKLQDAQPLMTRHALDKALAMGIPFFCSRDVEEAARARGLEPVQHDVTVLHDKGFTGIHHTQYLSRIAPYGIRWPDSDWQYGHKQAEDGKDILELTGRAQFVFPRHLAP
jgi:hypothetical protein